MKTYLAIPIALLLLFGGLYWLHPQTTADRARAAAAETARQKEADAKREQERQAKADADRRLAERLAEEKKQDDAKRAKRAAEADRLAAEVAAGEAQANTLAAEVAQAQRQLADLRARKDRLNRDTFELEKNVELTRLAKRTAELELQRLTALLATRASTLTPPTPATATAPR